MLLNLKIKNKPLKTVLKIYKKQENGANNGQKEFNNRPKKIANNQQLKIPVKLIQKGIFLKMFNKL